MTRIVAGEVGGRRLAVPPGGGTRPTSDRTREALFGTLGSLLDLAGGRVLDLYAGSGAVGLEALSRGAAHALLVESDPRAAAVARRNTADLGLAARAAVLRDRVERVLAAGPPDRVRYRLAYADPPYAMPGTEVDAVLAALADGGWLEPGAVLVVERASRDAGPGWPASLRPVQSRRYGEGTLWYGRQP